MTDEEWQALLALMHSPKVQAAVARYEPEPEAEEPGEAVQAEQARMEI